MNLAGHINEQAKAVNRNPSDGQKEAGNYRKGHVKVHGLDISIENPRGSYRSGKDPATGRPWRSRLPHHYGYIRRTNGADDQHVDVFLGPHLKSPHVFVIDQRELRSHGFDEHKVMIGFGSKKQATEAYHQAFSDGCGEERIGHIERMSIEQFKNWLRDGNTKAPVRRADGGGVRGMLEPGNIDLHNRPVVHNPDGSISTVRSMSREVDGREVLMPTVYGQSVLSDDDSERLYRMSGKHLGTFDTPANADAYGRSLHSDQEREYLGRAEGGRIPSFDETSDIPPFDQTEPVVDNGKMDAVLRGAAQGATFDLADEMAGAHAAGPKFAPMGALGRTILGAGRVGYDAITGRDPEATKAYEGRRDEVRKADEEAKKAHPYIHGAGQFVGAVPAIAATPGAGAVARLPLLAGKAAKYGAGMLDMATQGGIYGGATGVGGGTSLGERAMEGAKGVVGGIIGGGIAHGVGEIGRAAYNRFGAPVVGGVRGWFNPEGEAARRVASSLRADNDLIMQGKANGMTPQQWVAAKRAGEPVTLADLGSTNTQALLRSAANTSPDARAQLEKVIEDRFLSQNERVAETVRNVLPGGRANANKTADQLKAEYDAGRTPAYQQAYQDGDIQIFTPAIDRLTGSDIFSGAMKSAISSGKDRAVTEGLGSFTPSISVGPTGNFVFRKGGPSGGPVYPNLQYWDQVKRELDDVASAAFRAGENGKGDVASKMATLLRGELDAAVPSYKNARGIAEEYFGGKDALDAGRKLAGKKADPELVKQAMRKMKPDERALFQEGYASDLAERVIGNLADTVNLTKGRGIFKSPNDRKLAAAIFGPGGMAMLQARMSLETIMNGAREAMGNSTTARQLIEAGLAGGALSGYSSGWDPTRMVEGAGAFAAARGAPKFMAPQAVAGIKNFVGKVDAKTAARVAELLTSSDPRLLMEGYRMAAKNEAVGSGLLAIARRVALAGQSQVREPMSGAVKALQGPVAGRADQEQQRP